MGDRPCVPCGLTAQDFTLPLRVRFWGWSLAAHQGTTIEAWRGPFGGFGGLGKLGSRDAHFVPRCRRLQRLQAYCELVVVVLQHLRASDVNVWWLWMKGQ